MLIKEKAIEYVEQFIAEFKKEYPLVTIDYSYDDDNDMFDIWHDDRTLQFENKDFLKRIGTFVKEIFYANDIFNVSFGYDFEKDVKNMIKEYVCSIKATSKLTYDITNDLSDKLDFFSFSAEQKLDNSILLNLVSEAKILYNKVNVPYFNYRTIKNNVKVANNWLIPINKDRSEERLAA